MKYESILVYVLALLEVNISCYEQQQQTISKKKIIEWANKKEWANGLTLDLHPSVNRDSFYVAYHRNKKLWDAAFTF